MCKIVIFVALLIAAAWSKSECDRDRPYCSPDGKAIQVCTEGRPDPVLVENCDDGQTCIAENGKSQCVNKSKKEHTCTGIGEFPDPFDCSQTIVCAELFKHPLHKCKCPNGSHVLPAEGLKCVPGECPRRPIICKPGKSDVFAYLNGTSTEYYYYCMSEDKVEVYNENIWQRGVEFNVPGKECTSYTGELTTASPSNTSTTTATTTTKLTSTTTSSPQTTPPPTSTPQPTPRPTSRPPHNECRFRGQRFPSECECDYYMCDRFLNAIRLMCPRRTFYAWRLRVCVRGYCDESLCVGRE